MQGSGHIDDIFPYFLRFARKMFPHLDCMDDLKNISDLREPANWYPNARARARKIIFHAGPTNSGKTYHAMNSFMKAKTGVYCGPLKLLAAEVFNKCNSMVSRGRFSGNEDHFFENSSLFRAQIVIWWRVRNVNMPNPMERRLHTLPAQLKWLQFPLHVSMEPLFIPDGLLLQLKKKTFQSIRWSGCHRWNSIA